MCDDPTARGDRNSCKRGLAASGAAGDGSEPTCTSFSLSPSLGGAAGDSFDPLSSQAAKEGPVLEHNQYSAPSWPSCNGNLIGVQLS